MRCLPIDGPAMRSPLAQFVLASLYMGHFENIWLTNFHSSEVLFYRRFVDDILCLINFESDANLFFDFIDSQHPSISFIMETESSRCLPVLDLFTTQSKS